MRAANTGGNVPAVALPLLRIARTDKMRVVVRIPDRDVPFAQRGDPATITIDSLPNQEFQGKISRMSRTEEYDTRYMRVEIDLENPDGKLEDGMYGAAAIILVKELPGLRIPSSCLLGQGSDGRRTVFVVDDGKAKRRQVEVADDDGRQAQILSGLSAGDQVITGHLGSLQDGMPVTVVQSNNDHAQADGGVTGGSNHSPASASRDDSQGQAR